MKRSIFIGTVIGSIGPIILYPLVLISIKIGGFELYSRLSNLLDVPIVILFPFSILIYMGVEFIPILIQWILYGLLSILNIALFAGLGFCVDLIIKKLKT